MARNGELTPKQEKFARLVASGKSQAEAYRQSYDTETTIDESVHQMASRVAADINVASRINEIRSQLDDEARVTLTEHLAELKRLRDKADRMDEMNACIKAEELRGKASGIYVTKTEIKADVSVQNISDEELKSKIAELMNARSAQD